MVSIRAILVAILVLGIFQSSRAGKDKRRRRKHENTDEIHDKIVDSVAEEKDKKELDQDEPGSDEGSVSKDDRSENDEEFEHFLDDESFDDYKFPEDDENKTDVDEKEDEDWNDDEEEDEEVDRREEKRRGKNKRKRKEEDIEGNLDHDEHSKQHEFPEDVEENVSKDRDEDWNEDEEENKEEEWKHELRRKKNKREKKAENPRPQASGEVKHKAKQPTSGSNEIRKTTDKECVVDADCAAPKPMCDTRTRTCTEVTVSSKEKPGLPKMNKLRTKHPRCKEDEICKMILGPEGRCGGMHGMMRCYVAKNCERTRDCSPGFECLSPSEIKKRKAVIMNIMMKRAGNQKITGNSNRNIATGRRGRFRSGKGRFRSGRGRDFRGEHLQNIRPRTFGRVKRETRKEERKRRKEKKERAEGEDLDDLYNTEENPFEDKESENISETKNDQDDDTAEQSNDADNEGAGGKTDHSLSDERSEQLGGATDSVSTDDEEKEPIDKGDGKDDDDDDAAGSLGLDEPLPTIPPPAPKMPVREPEIEQKVCVKKPKMPRMITPVRRHPARPVGRLSTSTLARHSRFMVPGRIAPGRPMPQKDKLPGPPRYLRKTRGCLRKAMKRLMEVDFENEEWHGVNKENAIKLLFKLFPRGTRPGVKQCKTTKHCLVDEVCINRKCTKDISQGPPLDPNPCGEPCKGGFHGTCPKGQFCHHGKDMCYMTCKPVIDGPEPRVSDSTLGLALPVEK